MINKILKNRFTRKLKCHNCGKVKMVTLECEDCYFAGYDIDKQIKKLQELKKIQNGRIP